MKKILFIFTFLAGALQTAQAQTSVGLGLQLGVPMNEFRTNTQATGVGVNLNFYKPFAPQIPVYLGLNLGYMLYGSYTQQINEELLLQSSSGAVLSRIPVNLDVTTNNNMLNGNIALRAKAPFEGVQPYCEGIVGFNYLYTRTSIYDRTQNRMFTQNQESNLINAISFAYVRVLNDSCFFMI